MTGDYSIGKDSEGIGNGLVEVLSLNLPGRTEIKHGNPHSGQPVLRWRYEPGTCNNRLQSDTAAPVCSEKKYCISLWE